MVDLLYNPIVRANLMSASFACTYLGDEALASTSKHFRVSPRLSLKGHGILHNIIVHHNNVEMALDFHVFKIQYFDIMIGHPVEKLIVEAPPSGALDVKLGRDIFTIPITRAKNSVAESLPHFVLPMEVMSVLPFDSPESSLEKDATLFIEEEDDLGETIDLPTEEVLAQPLVELKPLPAGLRYAFLNGDKKHSCNH